MYKLHDRQGTGAMQGIIFKNKAEVLKQLKSYHQDIKNVDKMDLDDLLEVGDWELKKHTPTPECDVCGIEVIFNLHIYKITGMCGTCSTGEARLNYGED